MSKYDDFDEALKEVDHTMRVADMMADRTAGMLKGRLRNVSHSNLKALKKELTEFNSRGYGKWKS